MHKKIYTVRRLLSPQLDELEKCYSAFDFLHINPYKKDFLENVMLHGRIWGIYDSGKLFSCCCFFPGDMPFFADSGARWNIKDLLATETDRYLVMGYVWTDKEYENEKTLSLFARLAQDIALRSGIEKVLHCSAAHINTDMGQLISAGYRLAGLRGLDKLVPHYIFVSAPENKKHPSSKENEIKKCPSSNTKELSSLCEKGWRGTGIDGEGNIIFTYGR